ncbi:4-alpha-glucanotransferase [Pantoea osteomyelitidis]|uniref:4-alpha-glucanotransferase n=1 Tax=Pantoea osteomyelitidis TaxID=3230026 RepID=A0ABW7Q075_9GAMM
MKEKQLEKAASATGIAPSYINAKGEVQAISEETRQQLLAIMEHPTKEKAPPLPPAKVFRGPGKRELTVKGRGQFHWQLMTEKGKAFTGDVAGGDVLTLPPRLPQGYHELTLSKGKQQWNSRIIITPRRCYEPEALRAGERRWGALVQLYTLRSENNWGIGDFGDLEKMLVGIAERGGDFIGLNPLHALYPANPEGASPYSPSSRRWLNVLYIDVTQVEDFQQSKAAQRWWKTAKTRRALEKARGSEWVDYTTVAQLKLEALRLAWTQFSQRDEQDSAMLAFEAFVQEGGDNLWYQAAYDALQFEKSADEGQGVGWRSWPEAWQNTQLPAVQSWCEEHVDEIRCWMWLQWLAQTQFAQCWQRCQQLGMAVGLYRDLAVGVAESSAETWHDPELYRMKASVGAPPDRLGPLGQNWGLPPMDPHVMLARGYQPFIDLLRANMRDCGALRIDHVMAMLRLWWIPYGESADKGAYVFYPVDDLLAIMALESQRQRCMVIGEDLGTVPKEIVGKLRNSGIFSWKVLWFEQQRNGAYRLPQSWPRQSIASASTHDLPTLSGFWDAGDFALGEKLGLYPNETVLQQLHEQRAKQKQALLEALRQAGALAENSGETRDETMTPALNQAIHRFLAKTNSALLGLQPEDWLGMTTPVNVPGTVDEYPNWRRRLTVTIEALFKDEEVNRLLKEVSQQRNSQ